MPSRIAFATSATSARVGREEATIESSICVAVITGRASAPASAMICFWTIGTSSIRISMPRSPRATITQSAARTISSARWTACGFSIFAISGRRVCLRTSLDVLGAAHEAERDEVDADLLADLEVAEVLLGHRRQRGGLAGDVEPLARGDAAADLDHARRSRPSPARVAVIAQPHRAVGEVDHLAGPDRLGQPGPGDVHPPRVALGVVLAADERDLVAGLELGEPVDELADAQLRPRQVLQDRDLAPGAVGGVAHAARRLGVLLGAAVGEVQARDVHAGLDHPDEHLGLARGGADRGDDLRAAHVGGTVASSVVRRATRSTPSAWMTSPSALRRPPERRSQIMSQCTRRLVRPAGLGIGAAEREVDGAADLLVEQDRPRRPVDAGLVPIPISPSRRAPGSVSSVASRYSWPRSARASTTRPGAELELDPGDLDAARARRDREADPALGGVLDRAGEDLARRHVAPAVGVDPGAAGDARAAGRSRRPRCAARARGSSRSIRRSCSARSSPQARGRVVAVEERRAAHELGELGRAHAGALGARRRSARACRTSAAAARPRAAAPRARAARASRAGSTPASAVVFSGAWIVSDASVPLGLGQLGGGEAVEVPSRAAAHHCSAGAGQLGPQQRPGLALEQLALDGQQQRRGQRGRAHDDLLAGLRVEAVAAQQRARTPPGRSSRRRQLGELLGEVLAQHVADPAALRRQRRSGSGRAAPSGA